MFNIDQVITERVLRGHAASAEAHVEWNTRLESFQQDAEGVTVMLRSGDGEDAAQETVRANYLWGCDGGRSTVRKLLGLPLKGETAATWLTADAIVHTNLERDTIHSLSSPSGALMMFPFPDPNKWRLLDTSGEGELEQPEQIARQFSAKLSQALEREIVVDPPTWTAKFTIQQRAVPAMHVGRCFVSGDAAHVHSPASGRGLNTGIQDAYNLAWKLAMVVHGQADAVLLETYDAERVRIGQALLTSTGAVTNSAMADTARNTQNSDQVFIRQLIWNASGLNIAYTDSPLTVPDDEPGKGPRPGQRLTQISAADAQSPGWIVLRALLRTSAWHLLVFAGSGLSTTQDQVSAATAPDWLEKVTISPRRLNGEAHGVWDSDGRVQDTLAATAGDWILVRPDGYLSARGSGDTSLRDALGQLTSLNM
ncbi:NADPH-dependent dioxygenase [Deinococcus saxicola]